MHFTFVQFTPGDDGVDGDDEVDGDDGDDGEGGAVGEPGPDGSAEPEPVGAPPGVEVSDGTTVDVDGNPPPAREGPEPLGGADVTLLHAASTSTAIAPDTAATTLNRRRVATPKPYGPHQPKATRPTQAPRAFMSSR